MSIISASLTEFATDVQIISDNLDTNFPKHLPISMSKETVRSHRPKTRKNSEKLGKNVKNRLKIKEKAEILAQENFQK